MWKRLALTWMTVRGEAWLSWRALHDPASPRRLPPALRDEIARASRRSRGFELDLICR